MGSNVRPASCNGWLRIRGDEIMSFGMLFWGSIVGVVLFLVLFAIWWPMRNYVAIRRKDCCGKGCGCLFPVNLDDVKKD